jgi:predicted nuclease with TOPRIM domain
MNSVELSEKRDEILKQKEVLTKEANEMIRKFETIKTNIIRLEGVVAYLDAEIKKIPYVENGVK